jgi:hypothetical protein
MTKSSVARMRELEDQAMIRLLAQRRRRTTLRDLVWVAIVGAAIFAIGASIMWSIADWVVGR